MNKKVRSRSAKTVHELTSPARRTKMRHLQSRSRELDQEIHRLECTIAAAPHAIRRKRLASIDTLPALEPRRAPLRRSGKRLPELISGTGCLASIDTLPALEPRRAPLRRSGKRLPLQQQRAIKRQRMVLMIELGVVLAALGAALGWMNQWFHLWR